MRLGVFVGAVRLRESTGSGWQSARGLPLWCRNCGGKSNGAKEKEVRRCIARERRTWLTAFEQWVCCALGLDEHAEATAHDTDAVLALHGSRHAADSLITVKGKNNDILRVSRPNADQMGGGTGTAVKVASAYGTR